MDAHEYSFLLSAYATVNTSDDKKVAKDAIILAVRHLSDKIRTENFELSKSSSWESIKNKE
jgi:hypothetical protein